MDSPKNRVFPRLIRVRTGLVKDLPFFGRLLLRTPFGFAGCGTAYTDMHNIVFDPSFADRISDEEIRFVLLHEIYHIVLLHPLRGRGLLHSVYNVACDIVVNSLILGMMSVPEFSVDGCPAMHLTPKGDEGRNYTAEQVYEMLLKQPGSRSKTPDDGKGIDLHSVWSALPESEKQRLEAVWNNAVREAAQHAGTGTGIPEGLRRYYEEVLHAQRNDWRQLLHDFIQNRRFDFDLTRPDKRYQGEFILPSFVENDLGGTVENLWFLIDTSGSISDESIAEAFEEIRQASEQIDRLSGLLSFFDTTVSEPVPFESVEELKEIKPVGGRGTSFHAIFRALDDFFPEDLPCAILIITDGYAAFPEESAAKDIPVIWIIVNSEINPPWGTVLHINSSDPE